MARKPMALILALALLVAGCSASAPTTADSTDATAAASGSSAVSDAADAQEAKGAEAAEAVSSDVYPADYRTGVPEVDAVIEAFLAKDVDTLASCSTVNCREDAEGSLQPYVFYGSCQVNSLDSTWDSLKATLSAWTSAKTDEQRYLYAAYRVQDDDEQVQPDLRWGYFIQFASDRSDSRAKAAVLNQEGKIVQIWLGCGEPQLPDGEGFEPIAAPKVEQ